MWGGGNAACHTYSVSTTGRVAYYCLAYPSVAVTITCLNDQVHKSRLCFDSSECNGVTESRHETAYHIAGYVRQHEERTDDIDLV